MTLQLNVVSAERLMRFISYEWVWAESVFSTASNSHSQWMACNSDTG